jgi:hypothetical protein
MSGAARFFTETTLEHWLFIVVEAFEVVLVAFEGVEVMVLGPVVEEPERNE